MTKGDGMKIDLDRLTDAEIGRMVRASLTAQRMARIEIGRADVADVAEFVAERNATLLDDDRKKRHLLTHKGFLANGYAVPALDASQEILDALVSDAVRQTYNRARVSLGEKQLLDPETTTWRVIVTEHIRLSELARAKRDRSPQIAAHLGERTEAKVKALAEVFGISEESAKEVLYRKLG
jgi:hypothetical protein